MVSDHLIKARRAIWAERTQRSFPDLVWAAELKQAFVHFATSCSRDRALAFAIPHAVVNTDVSLYIGGKRWLPSMTATAITSDILPDTSAEQAEEIRRQGAGVDCSPWANSFDLRALLVSAAVTLHTPTQAALLVAAEYAFLNKDDDILRSCVGDGDGAPSAKRCRLLERLSNDHGAAVSTVLLGTSAPPCTFRVVAQLHGLRVLDASAAKALTLNFAEAVFIGHMMALTSLNLDLTLTASAWRGIFADKDSLPALRQLKLGRPTTIAFDFGAFLQEGAMPDLEDLRLTLPHKGASVIEAVGKRRLKKLCLREVDSIAGHLAPWSSHVDSSPNTPSALSTTLQDLDLCRSDFDDEAAACLVDFVSLTRLDFAGTNVSGTGVALMLSHMPNLLELNLSECKRLRSIPPPGAALTIASGARSGGTSAVGESMETLFLRHNTAFEVETIVPWVGRSLKTLVLLSCAWMSDERLTAVVRGCPQLQHIDVRYCRQLDGKAFHALPPSLEIQQSIMPDSDLAKQRSGEPLSE